LVSFSFFSPPSGAHRDLHSFPTRRSSDLRGGGKAAVAPGAAIPGGRSPARDPGPPAGTPSQDTGPRRAGMGVALVARRGSGRFRSEEHTSELQSRENLVCRLLLEKKNRKA